MNCEKYGKNFIITDENAEKFIEKMSAFIKQAVDAANRQGIVLGMSGGIDCCTVARLAQVAGVKIKLVMLPDGTDMEKSKSLADAMSLINKFGFEYEIINIKEACENIEKAQNRVLSSLSKINIRPRVRMINLYAIAQTEHCFVAGTSNLCERLLGYFTKWGDGVSDLNPLALLTKGEVRTLAKHLDIPTSIINKQPSAGLFEGQTDEADFGFSYNDMDKFILTGTSGNKETDQKIDAKIKMSAHKLKPISIFDNL